MAVSKEQVETLFKSQYGKDITFSNLRFVHTGGIFHRKHFAVVSIIETGIMPETDQADAHGFSKAEYFVVPVKSKKIIGDGMLFDLHSYDAYNMRYVNTEGKSETWRTCEVFLNITSGETELAKIRSSGTGDTPYIDASDNIQIQRWIERRLPVYDFVVSTGLNEQDEKYLNDNDIRKRRSYIYKFALEFFNTFIITKEEIKAEQIRLLNLQKEEERQRKQEQQKAREQEKAERKAWIERRADARVKVRMDDSKSLPKKNLMKSFLGDDIFE